MPVAYLTRAAPGGRIVSSERPQNSDRWGDRVVEGRKPKPPRRRFTAAAFRSCLWGTASSVRAPATQASLSHGRTSRRALYVVCGAVAGWGGGASWALWARRGAPRACRLGTVTRLGASRPLLRAPDSPPVLLRARDRGFTAPTMRVSAGPGGPSSHRTARLCLQNSRGVSGGGWSAGQRKSGPRRQPFAESSGARPRCAPPTYTRTGRAGVRAEQASTRRAERR